MCVLQVMPAPGFDDYMVVGSTLDIAGNVVNALGLGVNLGALVFLFLYRDAKYIKMSQVLHEEWLRVRMLSLIFTSMR